MENVNFRAVRKGTGMDKYILLYGDKKPEDNICITNMFENTRQINLGWTDFDYNHNIKIIDEEIKKGVLQIIFSGFEIGWDKLVDYIKKKNLKVKVICNTQDSLLYYEYERNNFFRLLELSKKGKVDDIAFLRKGQYEVYKSLGYNSSYLMENYILDDAEKKEIKKENGKIDIGIYPLNYTWDKNIFNQLCIGKMIDNSNVNYNELDERMTDFLTTMEIESKIDKIENINEDEIIKKVVKNDINVSLSFTEYFHPVFFISMEQGIPCIIGNTSDLFGCNEMLDKYIVTKAEDNPIVNAKLIEECLKNKQIIMEEYKKWKEKYNKLVEENKFKFLEK